MMLIGPEAIINGSMAPCRLTGFTTPIGHSHPCEECRVASYDWSGAYPAFHFLFPSPTSLPRQCMSTYSYPHFRPCEDCFFNMAFSANHRASALLIRSLTLCSCGPYPIALHVPCSNWKLLSISNFSWGSVN